MPPAFDRSPHQYDSVLSEWVQSRDIDYRAMARNLMHDHRVSADRERAFDYYVETPTTSRRLREAITVYYERRVRDCTDPDCIDPTINANNFLTTHKDLLLLRVLNLSGLYGVFEWGRKEGIVVTDGFPVSDKRTAGDRDGRDRWLADQVSGRADDDVHTFVSDVLSLLAQFTAANQPWQPTWATAWSAFKGYVGDKADPIRADRWAQVVGLYSPTIWPSWLVLLKYRARRAGLLIRPTQLDGNWNPYHFPSPPPELSTTIGRAGQPMDLGSPRLGERLVPEFIHKQIQHAPEDFVAIGQTTGTAVSVLEQQRTAHWERLLWVHGERVRAWMPAPA